MTSDNGHTGDPTWWPTDTDPPPTNVTTLHPSAPTIPPPPPPPPAPAPAQIPATPAPVSDNVAPAGRPPADRVRNARGALTRNRRWLAVGGVVILGMVVANQCANRLVDRMGSATAEPLVEHNNQLGAMVAGIAQQESAPANVSVAQPLAWLKCPITTDARSMIGLDPTTGHTTLDPARAGFIDPQIQALVVQYPLSTLRISSPDGRTLTVVAGGTQGVPLVDCTAGATPAKQGGEAATKPTG